MLLDQEQKCKAHAQGLPRQEVAKLPWVGIACRIGGKTFVTPLNEVIEVLRPPVITEVPGTVKWMIGVANLRGVLLPVADLQGLLGESLLKNYKASRILVVSLEDRISGLLVEQVSGLQKFLEEDKQAVSSSINPTYAPYIKGAFMMSGETWNIFSLQAVVESSQFCQVVEG